MVAWKRLAPGSRPWNYPMFVRRLNDISENIEDEVVRRVRRAQIHFRLAAQGVTSGPRTGRIYKLPDGSYYQASAPGEPFTVKSGQTRDSFETEIRLIPGIATWEGGRSMQVELKLKNERSEPWISGPLIELLEGGTKTMASRPTRARIIKKAWPLVMAEFNRRYFPRAAGR
jgi:hypothetical protein